MKYFKHLSYSFIAATSALMLSANLAAVEITLDQWQQIQSLHKKPVGAKVTTLQQSLNSAKDIYEASQQIKILSQQANLSAKQLHQLNKWRRAEAVIDIPSADHSGQTITIVNIAAEAKAAINAMKAKTKADSLYEKWNSNSFIYTDLTSFTGIAGQGAFLTFFNRLPPFLQEGFTDWSLEQLKEHHKAVSGEFNFMLYHLANRSESLEVAEYLLSQPANEHSHRFLTTLGEYFEEDAQLHILKLAAEKPKMRSQSYNGLAANFAHDTSAALVVAQALKQKNSYWSALNVVPAFVKAGNSEAFENVKRQLSEAQQKQLAMRLSRAN